MKGVLEHRVVRIEADRGELLGALEGACIRQFVIEHRTSV
jgi:hypothetical protein